MRISTSWLQEFIETPAPEKLNHVFEMAGIGVENYDSDSQIWTLEITSNRGDWLSAIGLAREIAAMTGRRFRTVAASDESTQALENISIAIENSEDCARYAARIIEGVRVGESPDWMQARLIECGMRPVNNIVDATNFVMLETGQPLHAFDADKVGSQIVVRLAKAGEKFVTLDEVERELTEEMLVIADAQNPIAVAGVMGGRDSEVTANTTRVLLESAHFAPSRVRRSARILELTSEASRRFARYVDPNGVLRAAQRACDLIAESAGGNVLPRITDEYPAPVNDAIVAMRIARCNAILGIEVSEETAEGLLKRLGFKVQSSAAGVLSVSIPTWRRDIEREIDLIEEVARLNDYENIPTTLPKTTNRAAGRSLSQRLEENARGVLLRCGLDEIVTYSLENAASVARAGLNESTPTVVLRNPLSDDYTQLRTSLLPSLLETLKTNAGANCDVRLFEIGKMYWPRAGQGQSGQAQPDEKQQIGIALLASQRQAHWQKDKAVAPLDFFDLKGIVERVLSGLGAPAPVFRAAQNAPFHPGRCATISIDGEDLGMLGEVHPDIAERYELRRRAYLAAIDFEALVRHIAIVPQYAPISRQPHSDRDLAVVVPEKVSAEALENTVRGAAGVLLESSRVFDVYQGAPIEPGFKSMAIALRFRAQDRTLGEDEIEAAMQNAREAAARDLGAQLRA